METVPRLLAIMGSGETSPTMVKTHRSLLARLGQPPVPAVVLDTPFGFQSNAADLAARAVEYFRDSVGHPMEVAHDPAGGGDPLAHETMLARLRSARYVFSGPGSPSYALRRWRTSQVPTVLAEKLHAGGCITFASAAALTLGVATVPVYEIYKAGEEPRWLEGLDLLGQLGVRAAVIPHYNNAEGGTHDTRYCYLGEDRLSRMEQDLTAGAFVLGVDEHTALVLDVGAGTATVTGLGVVTVRRVGASAEIPAGETVSIDELGALARGGRRPPPPVDPVEATGVVSGADAPFGRPPRLARSPLLDRVASLEAAFAAGLAGDDVDGAVRAVLELEQELVSWAHDTLQSDEVDRARAALRGMVVQLGERAKAGAADPAAAVRPFVEVLLAQRESARTSGRFQEADAVRRRLAELGVQVSDAPEGTTWRLVS